MFKIYKTNEFVKHQLEQTTYCKEFSKRIINTITIRANKTYQTHFGFGGAFTDSTSICYYRLSQQNQQKFVEAYFGEQGLKYNLGRIPVNSSDFSEKSLIYLQHNENLNKFDLSYEDEYRFPLIKKCLEKNKDIIFFVAPWSPPAYMKTNNSMCHGGYLKEEYRRKWAEYYAKFILELEQREIHISFATVQNEPEATQTWESRLVSAEEEALEIRDYLAPEFKRQGLDVKFCLWDHNRDNMITRAVKSFAIPGVEELIWGVAYHWYCCDKYENLSNFHELYPDKHMLLTEACVELAYDSKTGKSSSAGLFEHGERYAYQIINDLNNYSEGYIDWNLLLDKQGGPNHVGNYCEAPVMLDENNNLVFNPSYYYIGHFSKYLKPGAKRIFCAGGYDETTATAYLNPDNKVVIIILNKSDKDVDTAIDLDGKIINLQIEKHSIVTICQEE